MLFVVNGTFGFLGAFWLLDYGQVYDFIIKIPFIQMALVAILSLLASIWFGGTKFEAILLTGIRSKQSARQLIKIVAITFLAQLLVLSAFMIGAISLNPEIGFWSLLAAAAVTSFAASLPISVNGWGVREIAAIFAFGQAGMPPSAALAVSVMVGLCSTAVILVAWPYVFSNMKNLALSPLPVKTITDRLPIEKTATWGLVMATVILIFFQIHIPLRSGAINLNLADAFAILALSAVVTHTIYSRELPRWVIPKFNLLILSIGTLLLLAFLNGAQVIGITQWALAGRLLGWLILVGYLCIGILAISYLGRIGVLRIIETLIATAAVVVLFHATTRWLFSSGWIDLSGVTPNFEGFSGNRNALAFQLLVCSTLLLAYTSSIGVSNRCINLGLLNVRRDTFLAGVLGVLLAGLMFSGSKAGILTGMIILLASSLSGFADRGMLIKSIFYGFITWVLFVWVLPLITVLVNDLMEIEKTKANMRIATQGNFSKDTSYVERWETIQRGFDMWLNSPWLGAGLGVFIDTSTQWSKRPIVIHSTPVWILAEFGILGASILLGILSWVLIAIKKSGFTKAENRAAMLLLATFLIFSLVHEIFYQRIFWLVIGICIAMPFQSTSKQHLTGQASSK